MAERKPNQKTDPQREHRYPGQDEPEERGKPLTEDESRRHPEGRDGGRYPGDEYTDEPPDRTEQQDDGTDVPEPTTTTTTRGKRR
jgi:IMP dehydrogenase/GMP reductase